MDDDENLYDEFGNYVGPEVSDGESSEGERADANMMEQDEVMIGEALDEEESGKCSIMYLICTYILYLYTFVFLITYIL